MTNVDPGVPEIPELPSACTGALALTNDPVTGGLPAAVVPLSASPTGALALTNGDPGLLVDPVDPVDPVDWDVQRSAPAVTGSGSLT